MLRTTPTKGSQSCPTCSLRSRARPLHLQLDILLSSLTSPRAPQLGQTQSTVPPTILRKDRVSVRPHFTQNIQEGDHVRVPTTHVEPGSSSIGPNLLGPMKEPWPSAGGYKYPLLPEGQVFIILTSTLLSASTPTDFSIAVPCRYPPLLVQKAFCSEPAVTVQTF